MSTDILFCISYLFILHTSLHVVITKYCNLRSKILIIIFITTGCWKTCVHRHSNEHNNRSSCRRLLLSRKTYGSVVFIFVRQQYYAVCGTYPSADGIIWKHKKNNRTVFRITTYCIRIIYCYNTTAYRLIYIFMKSSLLLIEDGRE